MPCVYDANDHMVAVHAYLYARNWCVRACLNVALYLCQIADLNAYLSNVRPASISFIHSHALHSVFLSF